VSEVPVNVALDPFIEASKHFMELYASTCLFYGWAFVNERSISLQSPILVYNVGGCVSGGCWYGGGFFTANGGVITRVKFMAVCRDVGTIYAETVIGAQGVSLPPGMYRIDAFWTITLPDKGMVYIRPA